MKKRNLIFKKYAEFYIKFPLKITQNVTNGAGPKGSGHFVRDSLFYKFKVTEAANVHDFLYSEYGLREVTQKDADNLFLEMMLQDLKKHSLFSKILNKPLIYIYYFSVKIFGSLFWTKQNVLA